MYICTLFAFFVNRNRYNRSDNDYYNYYDSNNNYYNHYDYDNYNNNNYDVHIYTDVQSRHFPLERANERRC